MSPVDLVILSIFVPTPIARNKGGALDRLSACMRPQRLVRWRHRRSQRNQIKSIATEPRAAATGRDPDGNVTFTLRQYRRRRRRCIQKSRDPAAAAKLCGWPPRSLVSRLFSTSERAGRHPRGRGSARKENDSAEAF